MNLAVRTPCDQDFIRLESASECTNDDNSLTTEDEAGVGVHRRNEQITVPWTALSALEAQLEPVVIHRSVLDVEECHEVRNTVAFDVEPTHPLR